MVTSIIGIVLALAALGLTAHTLIYCQKCIDNAQNWAQSVSDECNEHLQAYYNLLMEAAQKDITQYFDQKEYEHKVFELDTEFKESVDNLKNTLKVND